MLASAIAGLLIASAPVSAMDSIMEAAGFRMQEIRKAKAEEEWPFVADSGTLMCTLLAGGKQVYFVPDGRDDLNRAYNLDVNIMSMSIVNLGMTDVLLPYDTPEQLLARIVPFVTMGQRLCNLEPGLVVPGTEL